MNDGYNTLPQTYQTYQKYQDYGAYQNTTIVTEQSQQAMMAMDSAYALAEMDAYVDKLYAMLTKQALCNTAVLSTVEDQCRQISPTAQAEYRMLVQAYAYRAARRIVGGAW